MAALVEESLSHSWASSYTRSRAVTLFRWTLSLPHSHAQQDCWVLFCIRFSHWYGVDINHVSHWYLLVSGRWPRQPQHKRQENYIQTWKYWPWRFCLWKLGGFSSCSHWHPWFIVSLLKIIQRCFSDRNWWKLTIEGGGESKVPPCLWIAVSCSISLRATVTFCVSGKSAMELRWPIMQKNKGVTVSRMSDLLSESLFSPWCHD